MAVVYRGLIGRRRDSDVEQRGLAISTAAVPEPDQVAAMGLLGLMGLVAAGRAARSRRH